MALTADELVDVPGVISRYVRLANGARAHYSTAGETGPAVVLVHGGIVGSSGMAGWRFMLPFLGANGFRVYAPDLPGYGWADRREEYRPRYGFKTWVDFLNQFVDALCLDTFFIAGNSSGAATVACYIVSNPERIDRFALIATGRLPWLMGMERVKRTELQIAPFDGTKASMLAQLEPITYYQERLTDDLLEMRTRAAARQKESNSARDGTIDDYNRDDKNLLQWTSLKGRLDKLSIPGIYLHGLQDPSAPVENSQVCEPLLPNLQFFYPDKCGHQGQTDQPEMFNQVFMEFFRDGKVSRKTADWAGVSKARPEIKEFVKQV